MRAYVQLVRAPAALTVLGDTVAGAAAAGKPLRGRRLLLPLSSAAFYWSGMALNDWADRELDATERPERPIPSGRVSPGRALAVAGGLTAAGLGLAAVAGGREAVQVAVPLGIAVWAYDTVLKSTVAGPVGMAACRALDVLMGGGGARGALPAA
ncbi:UbiA family prenyltransferase, partial [Actinophytocola sp.]|uniref:UbiA family prenyltransferase n=1 Tax=Actinophytocola sp. TaxID=1872138 RepID=UPI003D6B35CB